MVKTEQKEIAFDIYQPFGPSILKTKLPSLYVDALNAQADKILKDKKLSKERDWSHNLAGNVKKEISIDHIAIKTFPEFLSEVKERDAQWPLMWIFLWKIHLKVSMSEETKYDKRAKNIRYRFDREGFKKARWEQLERKEKDYWRGSIQQWDQDRSIYAKKRV